VSRFGEQGGQKIIGDEAFPIFDHALNKSESLPILDYTALHFFEFLMGCDLNNDLISEEVRIVCIGLYAPVPPKVLAIPITCNKGGFSGASATNYYRQV